MSLSASYAFHVGNACYPMFITTAGIVACYDCQICSQPLSGLVKHKIGVWDYPTVGNAAYVALAPDTIEGEGIPAVCFATQADGACVIRICRSLIPEECMRPRFYWTYRSYRCDSWGCVRLRCISVNLKDTYYNCPLSMTIPICFYYKRGCNGCTYHLGTLQPGCTGITLGDACCDSIHYVGCAQLQFRYMSSDGTVKTCAFDASLTPGPYNGCCCCYGHNACLPMCCYLREVYTCPPEPEPEPEPEA